MEKDKELILKSHHVLSEVGPFMVTQRHMDAIYAAMVSRGPRKMRWKSAAPKFGSPGYVAWQAKEAALTSRMPSECVMLLTVTQKALFSELITLFIYLNNHREDDFAKAFFKQLREKF